MEKWLDGQGLAALHMAGLATDRLQTPVQLSVDLRVQHALRDELVAARAKFQALAAAGIVLDVRTGEIVAMVSEPDFDPNNPHEPHDPTLINRLTTGVYEMGSTFKAFTIAMALDSGKVDAEIDLRRAQSAAFRQVRHPRFRADAARAHRAGNLHLFVEYRRRAYCAGDGHRCAQGVPEKDGPARSAAHRIAGERRADRAQALGRAEHDHHRLRPRPLGRAAAGGDGHGSPDERRHSHSAYFPQTIAGRGGRARQTRDQAGNQGDDALSDAAERREGHRRRRPRSQAIISAARPAPPTRSSTATIRKPGC